MGDSLAEPTWSIEVFDGGNFARFYSRLDEAERTVVEVAIEHVLAPLGIDICASEWGKNLGQGLFELRIRRDIETILREFGAAERVGEVPKRWRRKRANSCLLHFLWSANRFVARWIQQVARSKSKAGAEGNSCRALYFVCVEKRVNTSC